MTVLRRLLTVNAALLGVLLVILLVAPRLLGDNRAIINTLAIANCYVMFVASWDILSGYTGQVNFGHAAFIGAGGFTVGLLTKYQDVGPELQLLTATVVAALLGVAIGVPCLRLQGPYLALATLSAAAALLQLSFIFKGQTGGEEGISGVASLSDSPVLGAVGTGLSKAVIGSGTFDELRPLAQQTYGEYFATFVVMLVVVGGLMVLGYGRQGLVLRSIQQESTAAEAAGVPLTRYKLAAFVLSGAVAGLAGGLLVQVRGSAGIDLLFVDLSLLVIVIAALGGVGSIIGPALAAYVVVLLQDYYLDRLGFFQANPELKSGAFSLLLIIVLIVQPRGLVPPVLARLRARGRPTGALPPSGAGAGAGAALEKPR